MGIPKNQKTIYGNPRIFCDLREADCNRGTNGKSDRIPAIELLLQLHQRNEYLIGSDHPLKETLINQTGRTESQRRNFLNSIFQKVQLNPATAWRPKNRSDKRLKNVSVGLSLFDSDGKLVESKNLPASLSHLEAPNKPKDDQMDLF